MNTNYVPWSISPPPRRFTDDDVREIRAARLKTPPPSLNELAAVHGVTKQTIKNLLNSRTYRNVE